MNKGTETVLLVGFIAGLIVWFFTRSVFDTVMFVGLVLGVSRIIQIRF